MAKDKDDIIEDEINYEKFSKGDPDALEYIGKIDNVEVIREEK